MTDDTGSAYTRMASALADPDRLFTQRQVLYLLSLAIGFDDAETAYEQGRLAGYQDRVNEENAAYPPPAMLVAGGVALRHSQATERERAAGDRTQRYAGGPVEVWDADRADVPVPAVSTRVMRTAAGWVWRDA